MSKSGKEQKVRLKSLSGRILVTTKDHADRLLAYPNSSWEVVPASKPTTKPSTKKSIKSTIKEDSKDDSKDDGKYSGTEEESEE